MVFNALASFCTFYTSTAAVLITILVFMIAVFLMQLCYLLFITFYTVSNLLIQI